jgi:4-cresol dehydrogenase (hydroxylating)
VATLHFLDDRRLRLLETAHAALSLIGQRKRLERALHIIRQNYALLKGEPVIEPVLGAAWRLRQEPANPGDPLDSNAGLYWISPVVPMRGAAAMDLLRLAEGIFREHGFDMVVSMILLNERSLVGIMNVAFDKTDPEESRQGSACYEALLRAFLDAGYVIYRSGLQGMPALREHDSVYWNVAETIKRALDPEDIIARGRYIPPLTRD